VVRLRRKALYDFGGHSNFSTTQCMQRSTCNEEHSLFSSVQLQYLCFTQFINKNYDGCDDA